MLLSRNLRIFEACRSRSWGVATHCPAGGKQTGVDAPLTTQNKRQKTFSDTRKLSGHRPKRPAPSPFPRSLPHPPASMLLAAQTAMEEATTATFLFTPSRRCLDPAPWLIRPAVYKSQSSYVESKVGAVRLGTGLLPMFVPRPLFRLPSLSSLTLGPHTSF